MSVELVENDCLNIIENGKISDVDLSFLDPPFNQDKEYPTHNDSMDSQDYWSWMKEVCSAIYDLTVEGGAIYFMQREKNAEFVLRTLRKTGWKFQNLIIWRKTTSAVPSNIRYGKKYQIIAFGTKGDKPRVFNKLRHYPPLPTNYKREREKGIYLTDVWTDIRELTSGYFAGDEPLRDEEGNRVHKQQSPVELLARIILVSSKPGDLILDPFGGTGTTGVVARQLNRNCVLIEKDAYYADVIRDRLEEEREADDDRNRSS
ncbi:modification methylase [candidate division MSBL1 archaeon SCGC-AAA259I14]|uniref:Type II methyltransferase n=1 Tax=candidate division MSBL1 archaeon SCGC-AAA259I14 TaxID=1698268 RepID=A0A133UQJ8_9EURY|nr:modification methylase [candidate division MSBL1 archaeon SCGC-AAA259I14]